MIRSYLNTVSTVSRAVGDRDGDDQTRTRCPHGHQWRISLVQLGLWHAEQSRASGETVSQFLVVLHPSSSRNACMASASFSG
jgi:hypothetical protein